MAEFSAVRLTTLVRCLYPVRLAGSTAMLAACMSQLGCIPEEAAPFRSCVSRGHPGVLLVGRSLPSIWYKDSRAWPLGRFLSSVYRQLSAMFQICKYPMFRYGKIKDDCKNSHIFKVFPSALPKISPTS